jgi:uncharacterized membrane protein
MDSAAATAEPTAPLPARSRKPPMAISVVSVLLMVEGLIALVLGLVLAVPFLRCDALQPGAFDKPLDLNACLGTDLTLQFRGKPFYFVPVELLPDTVFFLVTGVVLLVLLAGFRRLRRWAWVGLTTWAGLNLAVALYRYFTLPGTHVLQYVQFVLNSLIVLALNMEEVQRLFGMRLPPPQRALRQAPTEAPPPAVKL